MKLARLFRRESASRSKPARSDGSAPETLGPITQGDPKSASMQDHEMDFSAQAPEIVDGYAVASGGGSSGGEGSFQPFLGGREPSEAHGDYEKEDPVQRFKQNAARSR